MDKVDNHVANASIRTGSTLGREVPLYFEIRQINLNNGQVPSQNLSSSLSGQDNFIIALQEPAN